MGIKHIPVDAGREPEAPAGVAGPLPGPEASPGRWHSVTVSSSPPHAAQDNAVLERSFQELVRYYRHSSVGRRCLGIVHQMNTPLQVLSFQLDLLEQKAQEELGLLTESLLADTDPLVTLNHYRQAKFSQLRRELNRLQGIARSLVLQGLHEDAQEKFPLDLNQLCRQELELYQADPFFKHQVTGEFHFQDGLPLILWTLYRFQPEFPESYRQLPGGHGRDGPPAADGGDGLPEPADHAAHRRHRGGHPAGGFTLNLPTLLHHQANPRRGPGRPGVVHGAPAPCPLSG